MSRRTQIPQSELPEDLRDYVLTSEAIDAIPQKLKDVDDFIENWDLWLQFRAKIKGKPVSNEGARRQLNDMLKHLDHANPVEVMQISRDRRWEGLFPKNVYSYEDQKQKPGLIL